ncbi:MAG: HAD-IA family hydrolase [Gemmatimonadales bacterium]|nr:HAD-IA family hydrolase [Gemmatimonadales bacterium]NIN12261.1 HAD-IA family hydrolase [Gemmatimonadales bacterium]NIN50663.1 HAD-IA family hydrolase [Gemmatimonadales bacterium]NIP08127.1 HAD-IA family hydrolase [Gemmatimonadales bacterium]NIR03420.1 HAD-IA family hydrolase [Gemmatimonadales bacterium]
MIKTVAFDADDTLWHNEPLYSETTERFRRLLSAYHSPQWIGERLYETETRNLQHYGYGIKSFTLSMIETAIELTEGRIKGSEIQEILRFAKEMLQAPVRLLDHAAETVKRLAESYELMIITKGDLFDQESKVARSGLGDYFAAVEIVTEKDPQTYRAVASKSGVEMREFLMVGDSLKSDVLPVLEAGGHAIYVPYATPWQHETVPAEVASRYDFMRAGSIREIPGIIEELAAAN